MSRLSEEQARAYWKRNLALVVRCLVIWFVVSYGFGILLVDVLNQVQVGGYRLGFWFAQQGSIYVFVLLILTYLIVMNRLDAKFGFRED